MGGRNSGQHLWSVDIIDASTHTVAAAPCMNVTRSNFASAVIGHCILVAGGQNDEGRHDSVEYLDFAEERKDDFLTTVISFSSTWMTHCSPLHKGVVEWLPWDLVWLWRE